jgi:hypothetical protein
MTQETVGEATRFGLPVQNYSVLLSSTPRGARLARLLATEQLRAWELPLDPARLIVAELATNAATHGRVPGRDFRLTLHLVTDTRDDTLPETRPLALDAESGRGLTLVETLSDRWGVTLGPRPRKTTWAELDVTASSCR